MLRFLTVEFDRLLMLKNKTVTLGEILPFHWHEIQKIDAEHHPASMK